MTRTSRSSSRPSSAACSSWFWPFDESMVVSPREYTCHVPDSARKTLLPATGRGRQSQIVAQLTPESCEWYARTTAHVDRQVAVLRQHVGRPVFAHALDRAVLAREHGARYADHDDRGVLAARPPEIVLVVTADRRRQIVPPAEELDRSCLTVVPGQNRGRPAFARRKAGD